MDGEADSRKPLQTGALENGFEYLTDNPDNSNPVTRTIRSVLRVCLKFFDKREGKADNKGKQAGDEGECDNIQAISAGKSMRRYERI